MRDQQFADFGRNRYVDQPGITPPRGVNHPSDRVDMPLNQVSAESITRPKRALEVHPRPDIPIANRGPIEGRGDRGHGEPTWSALTNGETGTIQGDALARHEIGVGAPNAQLAPDGRCRRQVDRADVVNYAGEHA